MAPSPIARLRKICLALPEATEVETWEQPTFRVRGKIFAMIHRHEDELTVWMKAPPGVQDMLVEAAPERFFRPPYVGSRGWIGMHIIKAVDWEEVEAMVRRSFLLIAPKRVGAKLAP